MSITYAWQNFYKAVSYCMASENSLQERLAGAYVGDIHVVQARDVTPELWERIEKLTTALTMLPAVGNEGTVRATTSKMTDDEARQWLDEILSIFIEITKLERG